MGAADYIALGIIFFLLFCAVKYMLSPKKGGCCGNCAHCRSACAQKTAPENTDNDKDA